ncbi:L,D-transpeptidase family protein [Rhizomonospora bruguierae]|uniref:L,D-transpeptidase family protein n=1 Tax=Rhizomonospora bruguierae TaxID=1581705 RepID=UPI001BCEFC44|nr:L,D-transpeptidase family protein [Micromonospora sp. NBRC 107566]
MARPRIITRLAAVAVVTLVGAGGCAFESAGSGVAGRPPASGVATATGASAAAGPAERAAAAVDTTTTVPATVTATTTKAATGCPTGEHQREVEKYLAKLGGFGTITVDGKQSATDCAAIKKFQSRYGIKPVQGRAGPTTYSVAKRLASTDTRRCKAGAGLTFCVDLTHQTVWAMRDGKVVMAPTITRTGMRGYRTPAGTYRVNLHERKEWSDPYRVWLPYWQRFVRGIGFHETTTYIHNTAIGSHGCVNLLPADAVKLYGLGKVGTRVYVFGRRPGT